jgi:Flp pilus assembly protein TadB
MKTFIAVFLAIIAAAVVIGGVVYVASQREKAARISAEISREQEIRDRTAEKVKESRAATKR